MRFQDKNKKQAT